MSTKERLKEFIKSENLTITDFEKSIGVANGYVNSISRGIGIDKIEAIIEKYPKINIAWLIIGRGEMLTEDLLITNQSRIDRNGSAKSQLALEDFENKGIPIYDINGAKDLDLLFNNGTIKIINTIHIPNMSKCDGALFVAGNSMSPLIENGDIVLFKQIVNIDYLHLGSIYLVSYNIGDDDYLAIKYLNQSEIKNHLKLTSYNKDYPPIDIPISTINTIASVRANIRYNTMQ